VFYIKALYSILSIQFRMAELLGIVGK